MEYKCERCRFRDYKTNKCVAMNSDYFNLEVEAIKEIQYQNCNAFF